MSGAETKTEYQYLEGPNGEHEIGYEIHPEGEIGTFYTVATCRTSKEAKELVAATNALAGLDPAVIPEAVEVLAEDARIHRGECICEWIRMFAGAADNEVCVHCRRRDILDRLVRK